MCNKVRVIFLTGLMMLTSVMFSFAQDNPNCEGDDDPDTYCPLDNWVWILVLLTLILAFIYWERDRNRQFKIV
jgi:hypothetical protein